MRLCNRILALAIVPFFRSLFSSDEPDETHVAKPFSRADILFNQSVDKLAILFEENKGEKGCHLISSMAIDQADKQIISIYYLYLRTHYTF